MLVIKSTTILSLLAVVLLIVDCQAVQPKRALPLGSNAVKKRNLGGQIKDWYLAQETHNYFCTDTGRLVPVDPDTGHMLLKGLRKRGWIDDMLGHSHQTEHGLCKNPSWVLPPQWTQPIPVTQFLAQYPWMTVDERGQIRLRDDFRAWIDQRAAANAANPAAAAGGAGGAGGGQGAVPDGGAGYIPPSAMQVAPGTGTTSGFGTAAFGNGVAAGAAAHV
ncbi:uncharacterized protein SRS1_10759 [Sporisorium reilianum f. sp. reilianum]|uniref:Uncharacterized protein n=1 Tax=Sporisorium reilianum f. sp. reilianum TaxID=72559 RepID=A0A2N8UC45_9BASI|nr:uncharacterized protein SRS1_10759 [Sporisorium reilianum f. sp. reilianum]